MSDTLSINVQEKIGTKDGLVSPKEGGPAKVEVDEILLIIEGVGYYWNEKP